ncbi:GIY-YIG nuclease family protein [Ixodes scapularis]
MSRRRPDRAERTRDVVCIPYVKGISEALGRALRPLGVRTVYKPYRTIANVISKPKDPTPPEAERGVIYQVQCKECDASYIGETGRKRKTRLKEHARDAANSTNATRFKSELVDHAWTSGHQFDFDKASTLARDQRWGPRKLLESWFIQKDKRGSDSSLVNKNRGPLPEVYANFMPK